MGTRSTLLATLLLTGGCAPHVAQEPDEDGDSETVQAAPNEELLASPERVPLFDRPLSAQTLPPGVKEIRIETEFTRIRLQFDRGEFRGRGDVRPHGVSALAFKECSALDPACPVLEPDDFDWDPLLAAVATEPIMGALLDGRRASVCMPGDKVHLSMLDGDAHYAVTLEGCGRKRAAERDAARLRATLDQVRVAMRSRGLELPPQAHVSHPWVGHG